MPELNSDVLRNLWIMAKAGQKHEDPEYQRIQKYMVLHGDMHEIWDRLEADPSTSLVIDNHDVMLHIGMDAAAEKSIEQDEPKGMQQLFVVMRNAGIEETVAFHVISRSLYMEFLQAATLGKEVEMDKLYARAAELTREAVTQHVMQSQQAT
jgi:hypothetical protein